MCDKTEAVSNIFCEPEIPTLLDEVSFMLKYLDSQHHQKVERLRQNNEQLKNIYNSCDSILDSYKLDDEKSINSLAKSLIQNGCTFSVLLPSKVSIGRTYTITKFNLYGYLSKLCNKYPELYKFRKNVLIKWEKLMYMLLIEEVYQKIIERPVTEQAVRSTAAGNLIKFWEYRDLSQNTSFAVNIYSLWSSRRSIIPAFGTMLGTVELMQLSSILSIRWHKFLEAYSMDREMLQTLEEFIFGLPFEYIKKIRAYMTEKNVFAIDYKDIKNILDSNDPRPLELDADPRQMYSFYRKRASWSAHRGAAESGPLTTIEELFMTFLLSEQLNSKEDSK
ncbi:MAG: hypothetical protein PQJ61_14115 [Spirochaetales bacterium]|uniref:Uncharacterized protein n=1 Tax=Candidatus Thalassospirochaeta sargassi TaxID=3119039 RepID=A0AAJ1MKL0_9SPIO|nr:hypothetical protein [Spirochaetales bacterium]